MVQSLGNIDQEERTTPRAITKSFENQVDRTQVAKRRCDKSCTESDEPEKFDAVKKKPKTGVLAPPKLMIPQDFGIGDNQKGPKRLFVKRIVRRADSGKPEESQQESMKLLGCDSGEEFDDSSKGDEKKWIGDTKDNSNKEKESLKKKYYRVN